MLSDIEEQLISLISADANCSTKVLAHELGVSERVVRYHLQHLQSRRILRKEPLMNLAAAGYRTISIYYQTPLPGDAITSLRALLSRSQRATWCAKVGGNWNIEVSFVVRDFAEIGTVLQTFQSQSKLPFSQRELFIHEKLTLFSMKYLSPRNKKRTFLSYDETDASTGEIDLLDHKILQSLTREGVAGSRDIAKLVGAPHTTVALRVRRLENAGIIQGYWFSFPGIALPNHSAYKLLVSLQDRTNQSLQRVFDFSLSHQNVTYLIQGVGAWDFELGLELQFQSGIFDIVEALQGTFGKGLINTQIIPVEEVVRRPYPFRDAPVQR